jgi:hypothetical protein
MTRHENKSNLSLRKVVSKLVKESRSPRNYGLLKTKKNSKEFGKNVLRLWRRVYIILTFGRAIMAICRYWPKISNAIAILIELLASILKLVLKAFSELI